jgi:hypothetical protein
MAGLLPRVIGDSRNLSLSQAVSASAAAACGNFSIRFGTERTSSVCPAVRSKAIRQPEALATAWILVVRPPRPRPIACSWPPVFPLRRGDALEVVLSMLCAPGDPGSASAQHRLSDAVFRPSVEPIIDRGVRAIHRRTIAPTAADLQTSRLRCGFTPRRFVGISGFNAAHCRSPNQNSLAISPLL